MYNDYSAVALAHLYIFMMTSSNGNTFRVTGPLFEEFTGPGEFPTQRPVTRSFDVFFDLRHRGHYDVSVMFLLQRVYHMKPSCVVETAFTVWIIIFIFHPSSLNISFLFWLASHLLRKLGDLWALCWPWVFSYRRLSGQCACVSMVLPWSCDLSLLILELGFISCKSDDINPVGWCCFSCMKLCSYQIKWRIKNKNRVSCFAHISNGLFWMWTQP